MALPRGARGMNEVEWVTSRRYLPYRTASYALALGLCWGFWFLSWALPVHWFLSASTEFTAADANAFVFTIGFLFATLLTIECGLIWFMEDAEDVMVDRAKVQVLFGHRSRRELRAAVWSRRAPLDRPTRHHRGTPFPAKPVVVVRPYRP